MGAGVVGCGAGDGVCTDVGTGVSIDKVTARRRKLANNMNKEKGKQAFWHNHFLIVLLQRGGASETPREANPAYFFSMKFQLYLHLRISYFINIQYVANRENKSCNKLDS